MNKSQFLENQQLLTADEVAEYIHVSKSTLYSYRANGIGPRYILLNNRIIRYLKSDVEEWLSAQKIQTFNE